MTKPPSQPNNPDLDKPDEPATYKVGPGSPPREHQFKPGRSGNPKGRKKKSADATIAAILSAKLQKKIWIARDGKKETMTVVEVALEQLINQFAKGDRHTARILFDLARELKLPIFGTIESTIVEALQPSDEAILARYVAQQNDGREDRSSPSPVIAPAELLDDDTDSGDDN